MLTIASEAFIGNPTTATDVPIVDTPLTKATEIAPVDACCNLDVDLDGTGDEEYEWDDDVMNDLEGRFERLRQFNKKFNESRDKDTREETSIFIDSTRHDIEELIAYQIYDKLTILFNNTRKKLIYREVEL